MVSELERSSTLQAASTESESEDSGHTDSSAFRCSERKAKTSLPELGAVCNMRNQTADGIDCNGLNNEQKEVKSVKNKYKPEEDQQHMNNEMAKTVVESGSVAARNACYEDSSKHSDTGSALPKTIATVIPGVDVLNKTNTCLQIYNGGPDQVTTQLPQQREDAYRDGSNTILLCNAMPNGKECSQEDRIKANQLNIRQCLGMSWQKSAQRSETKQEDHTSELQNSKDDQQRRAETEFFRDEGGSCLAPQTHEAEFVLRDYCGPSYGVRNSTSDMSLAYKKPLVLRQTSEMTGALSIEQAIKGSSVDGQDWPSLELAVHQLTLSKLPHSYHLISSSQLQTFGKYPIHLEKPTNISSRAVYQESTWNLKSRKEINSQGSAHSDENMFKVVERAEYENADYAIPDVKNLDTLEMIKVDPALQEFTETYRQDTLLGLEYFDAGLTQGTPCNEIYVKDGVRKILPKAVLQKAGEKCSASSLEDKVELDNSSDNQSETAREHEEQAAHGTARSTQGCSPENPTKGDESSVSSHEMQEAPIKQQERTSQGQTTPPAEADHADWMGCLAPDICNALSLPYTCHTFHTQLEEIRRLNRKTRMYALSQVSSPETCLLCAGDSNGPRTLDEREKKRTTVQCGGGTRLESEGRPRPTNHLCSHYTSPKNHLHSFVVQTYNTGHASIGNTLKSRLAAGKRDPKTATFPARISRLSQCTDTFESCATAKATALTRDLRPQNIGACKGTRRAGLNTCQLIHKKNRCGAGKVTSGAQALVFKRVCKNRGQKPRQSGKIQSLPALSKVVGVTQKPNMGKKVKCIREPRLLKTTMSNYATGDNLLLTNAHVKMKRPLDTNVNQEYGEREKPVKREKFNTNSRHKIASNKNYNKNGIKQQKRSVSDQNKFLRPTDTEHNKPFRPSDNRRSQRSQSINIVEATMKERRNSILTRKSRVMESHEVNQKKYSQRKSLLLELKNYHNNDVNPQNSPWQGLDISETHMLYSLASDEPSTEERVESEKIREPDAENLNGDENLPEPSVAEVGEQSETMPGPDVSHRDDASAKRASQSKSVYSALTRSDNDEKEADSVDGSSSLVSALLNIPTEVDPNFSDVDATFVKMQTTPQMRVHASLKKTTDRDNTVQEYSSAGKKFRFVKPKKKKRKRKRAGSGDIEFQSKTTFEDSLSSLSKKKGKKEKKKKGLSKLGAPETVRGENEKLKSFSGTTFIPEGEDEKSSTSPEDSRGKSSGGRESQIFNRSEVTGTLVSGPDRDVQKDATPAGEEEKHKLYDHGYYEARKDADVKPYDKKDEKIDDSLAGSTPAAVPVSNGTGEQTTGATPATAAALPPITTGEAAAVTTTEATTVGEAAAATITTSNTGAAITTTTEGEATAATSTVATPLCEACRRAEQVTSTRYPCSYTRPEVSVTCKYCGGRRLTRCLTAGGCPCRKGFYSSLMSHPCGAKRWGTLATCSYCDSLNKVMSSVKDSCPEKTAAEVSTEREASAVIKVDTCQAIPHQQSKITKKADLYTEDYKVTETEENRQTDTVESTARPNVWSERKSRVCGVKHENGEDQRGTFKVSVGNVDHAPRPPYLSTADKAGDPMDPSFASPDRSGGKKIFSGPLAASIDNHKKRIRGAKLDERIVLQCFCRYKFDSGFPVYHVQMRRMTAPDKKIVYDINSSEYLSKISEDDAILAAVTHLKDVLDTSMVNESKHHQDDSVRDEENTKSLHNGVGKEKRNKEEQEGLNPDEKSRTPDIIEKGVPHAMVNIGISTDRLQNEKLKPDNRKTASPYSQRINTQSVANRATDRTKTQKSKSCKDVSTPAHLRTDDVVRRRWARVESPSSLYRSRFYEPIAYQSTPRSDKVCASARGMHTSWALPTLMYRSNEIPYRWNHRYTASKPCLLATGVDQLRRSIVTSLRPKKKVSFASPLPSYCNDACGDNFCANANKKCFPGDKPVMLEPTKTVRRSVRLNAPSLFSKPVNQPRKGKNASPPFFNASGAKPRSNTTTLKSRGKTGKSALPKSDCERQRDQSKGKQSHLNRRGCVCACKTSRACFCQDKCVVELTCAEGQEEPVSYNCKTVIGSGSCAAARENKRFFDNRPNTVTLSREQLPACFSSLSGRYNEECLGFRDGVPYSAGWCRKFQPPRYAQYGDVSRELVYQKSSIIRRQPLQFETDFCNSSMRRQCPPSTFLNHTEVTRYSSGITPKLEWQRPLRDVSHPSIYRSGVNLPDIHRSRSFGTASPCLRSFENHRLLRN